MKKTILIVLVLALLAPVAAFGATEFSLGGYIKLDMFWDSTQQGKNALVAIPRNNDALGHHGHFDMTSQASRFNFTIKGPKLWGATTTGFIEMDFDLNSDALISAASGVAVVGAPPGATHNYMPRLRHAMFRLNWPETELLFGQYWGMFSEYSPETTGDADFAFHGWANQRVPQIRFTQKFAGAWTVAGAIMKPFDPSVAADANFFNSVNENANGATTLGLEGQSAEMPQLQGKVAYEQDLWGKAPFFGRPRGFTAQLTGGWQRSRYRADQRNDAVTPFNPNTFGQNVFNLATPANTFFQNGQQYLDPWMVQGTLFIPVVPCLSSNMAGSASLTAQYFIGQGVSAFGAGRDADNSWFDFNGVTGGLFNHPRAFLYERRLMSQFGGYTQAQYWFTNQWFLNATWGFIRDYGIDRGQSAILAGQNGANNPQGNKYATFQDQQKLWSEFDLTLWYRPIEAFKFGLQYAYERSDYLQKVNNPSLAAAPAVNINGNFNIPPAQPNAGAKDVGESHRIQFVAFMFF